MARGVNWTQEDLERFVRESKRGSEEPRPWSEAVPTKSKYNARKKQIGGMVFDSAHEARVYLALEARQRAGEITNIERQVTFELLPKSKQERAAKYIADFVVTYRDGSKLAVDAKGFRTRDYVLKRKMYRAFEKKRGWPPLEEM